MANRPKHRFDVPFDPPGALLDALLETQAPRRQRCAMSRLLSHFGLREAPFSKEIADGELWMPSFTESDRGDTGGDLP
jgi:hypothetical protein